jgi:hypothetical protein
VPDCQPPLSPPGTPTCLCRNQKIHWVSEPGSASYGVEIANRGQIRFLRKGPAACRITLTISYEVPDVLAPFANVGGRWGLRAAGCALRALGTAAGGAGGARAVAPRLLLRPGERAAVQPERQLQQRLGVQRVHC